MSGKFQFYWNNLADATATTETVSSANADYPAANLANIWPSYVWRTSSLASPDYIKWDLGSAQSITCFVLWNHNITSGATIKIQANATDSWATPSVDQAITWTTDKLIYVFSAAQSYQWWRFICTDAANPAGYISAGHRFLGTHFQPATTFAYRVPSFVDPSVVGYSRGGQLTAAQMDGYDQMSYEFRTVSAADKATMKTIYRALGRFKPYYIVEDADDADDTVYYVHNIADWKFENPVIEWESFQLHVESMR
jgi:hypothetical protein